MALMVLVARRVAMRRRRRARRSGEGGGSTSGWSRFLGHRQRADAAGRHLRVAALPERHRILVLRPGADRCSRTPSAWRRSTPGAYEPDQRDIRDGRRRRRRHQRVRHRQPDLRRGASSTRQVYAGPDRSALLNVGRTTAICRPLAASILRRPAAREALSPRALRRCGRRDPSVVTMRRPVEAVVRLDPQAEIYLYGSRTVNPAALRRSRRRRAPRAIISAL
jgi:hypothetical protein